jgi:molybdenum cofactor synthesis domain-containing protein
MLFSMLSQHHCTVEDQGTVQDDPQELRAKFSALRDFDVVVTTGGVSMGDADFIKPFLHENGTVFFGRLNMKPGKPTTFAKMGNSQLVFALPGNPTSAFVTAKLFLPLALSCFSGA